MARKKITPEEETPKTVTPEESAASDVGDMTQNDLLPGESGTAEGRGAEAVPAMEAAEDAGGMSVGEDSPKQGRPCGDCFGGNANGRYSCRGGSGTCAHGRTTYGGRNWA